MEDMKTHSLHDFFVPYEHKSGEYQKTADVGSYAKVSRTRTPETLVWDITFRCNLKCVHCYNAEKYGYGTPDYGKGFTDLATAHCKDVIDWAKDSGIVHIHMLGGEPLTRPDLPEIISYATQKGLVVTITSNGTLVTESLARKLIEAGVEQISISLDGGTAETNDSIRGEGSFVRIMKGLEILHITREVIKPSFEIGISFTLTNINLNELSKVLEIGRERKVDVIVFQDLFDLGISEKRPDLLYGNDEEIDALENLVSFILENPYEGHSPVLQIDISYPVFRYIERKYRAGLVTPERLPVCPAATNLIYMDSDGLIYPCVVADKGHKGIYFKNSTASLVSEPMNIQSNPKITEGFGKFFDTRESLNFSNAPCGTCDYRTECLPCPLLVTFEQARGFSICRAVFKREREFEWPILHGSVRLSDNNFISRNEKGSYIIKNYKTGESFHIEGSGQNIVEMLDGVKTKVKITDVVDNIYNIYNVKNKRKVVRDVIDFIWQLHLIGVAAINLADPGQINIMQDSDDNYPLIRI